MRNKRSSIRATSHFEAACFGMSGGPADKEAILSGILPARKLVVTHDALIALSGATAGEPGVVIDSRDRLDRLWPECRG